MFEVEYTQTLNEYMDYIKELINEGWEGIELLPQRYDYELYPFLYKTRMCCQARLELAEKEQKKKAKAQERKRRQYEKLKKEFEPNGISN
jgi:hypothetical protein